MNKSTHKLVTIKVTEQAADNFRLAAALGKKKQHEVSYEGSEYVLGKYTTSSAIKKVKSKTK